MKKSILLLFIVLFLTSGCGCQKEKIVSGAICKYYDTREGNKYNTEVKIDIDNDKVTNAVATITYDNEDLASQMCAIYKVAEDKENVSCDGKVITIKDFHKSVSKAENKTEMTKDEIIKYFEKQVYDCELQYK